MNHNIFSSKNRELKEQFYKGYATRNADWIICGDVSGGVAVHGGVMCWFSDDIEMFALDARENRTEAIRTWLEIDKQEDEECK